VIGTEQRIARGRKAVALARERGVDTSSWESELGELERRFEEAERVAGCTALLLEMRGWCLWRCEALGGDTIAVVRDDQVEGVPGGVVVYTEPELRKLFCGDKPVAPAILRLIHEGKKLAGAEVSRHGVHG